MPVLPQILRIKYKVSVMAVLTYCQAPFLSVFVGSNKGKLWVFWECRRKKRYKILSRFLPWQIRWGPLKEGFPQTDGKRNARGILFLIKVNFFQLLMGSVYVGIYTSQCCATICSLYTHPCFQELLFLLCYLWNLPPPLVVCTFIPLC